MAYHDASTLRDRFSRARQCLIEMFPSSRRPGKTYQGFIKAVLRISTADRATLQEHLCRQHEQVAAEAWRCDGWVPLAADGSRFELPHTQANKAAFGCAGREKTGPQLGVLTLYHMGSGLPWRWDIGSGTASERHQLRDLLPSLPSNTLLVMDAGFSGYDLFSEMARRGVSFLARVGANVTLLKDLGLDLEQRDDVVWLWPSAQRNRAPLHLRLMAVSTASAESGGRQDVYLLSNVLDPERLSDEAAERFYRRRWGVEVFYRSVKGTFDAHKLLSRGPQQAVNELHWTLTAILLLGLMSVDALRTAGHEPSCLSVAEALRTVRDAMNSHAAWRRRGDLRVLLADARKDRYHRRGPKTAGDYPRKNRESPPKPPNLRPATAKEITCAKRIYDAA